MDKNKKILIVDDNSYLASYLEKKFTEAGHEVVVEATGLSALTRLAEYTPDFMFIDYVLPHINGDKLCLLIRRMDHLRPSYLVLMSAAAKEMQLDPTGICADLIIAKGTHKETATHLLAVMAEASKLRPEKIQKGIIGQNSVSSRRMTLELLGKYNHQQAVLDSISEGILESYGGQIVYANPAASAILNKTQEQLLAAHPTALFPESEKSNIQSLLETQIPKPSIIPLEKQGKRKKIVALKKLPLPGDPETIILLLTDVTDQIHGEAELRNYQTHLEKVVEERTADLKQAHDKLNLERESLSKSEKRLRFLTAQLLSIQERERKRISLELHDELGQTLTAVQLHLQQVEKELPADAARTKEKMEETRSIVEQASQQVRELSLFLRPSMLDDLGLMPTLRWHLNGFRQRANLEIQFEVLGMEERLDQEIETALYRIIQETLNNIAKYAQAQKVTIGLHRQGEVIEGYIQDDGKGFDLNEKLSLESFPTGIGLIGMRERATLLGGRLTVESGPGQGTRISFEVPLHREEPPWKR